MPSLPTDVVLREVGLRDGLQSIQTILPTDRKIEWIRDAYAAGQRDIEVGSFVPARLLPQLADTAELVAYAKTLPDLCVSVLVPNSKTLIEGGIGTAFGCTIQGYVSQTDVLRCMQALLDAGADRVSIADTVGYAGRLPFQPLCDLRAPSQRDGRAVRNSTRSHRQGSRAGCATYNANIYQY